MGFINPVVESDDSDDYIFERERSVSVVFDTLMNQWCINRGKHLFKFACKFHAFSKILEMLETDIHKSSIFNTTAKIKCHRL